MMDRSGLYFSSLLKPLLVCFLCIASFAALSGQVRETLYSTFPVDGATAVSHSLPGSITMSSWVGNQIMVEMTLLIENGTQRLLEHFVENDRYKIEVVNEGGTLRIFMINVLPEYILASGSSMFERVEAVIYYPENLVNLMAAEELTDYNENSYEQDSIR